MNFDFSVMKKRKNREKILLFKDKNEKFEIISFSGKLFVSLLLHLFYSQSFVFHK